MKEVIKALKADHKTSPKSSAQQTPRDTHGMTRYKEEYEQLVAFRNLVKWLQNPISSFSIIVFLFTNKYTIDIYIFGSFIARLWSFVIHNVTGRILTYIGETQTSHGATSSSHASYKIPSWLLQREQMGVGSISRSGCQLCAPSHVPFGGNFGTNASEIK